MSGFWDDVFSKHHPDYDGQDDDYDAGDYLQPTVRRRPDCKHCGETCTWHHTGVRWALLGDDGRLHQCLGKPATADDFA